MWNHSETEAAVSVPPHSFARLLLPHVAACQFAAHATAATTATTTTTCHTWRMLLQLVSSFNPWQHLQNFCHDSQLCHTHTLTHTDTTWPSFSFRFCIFHFNCQFSVEFSAFSEFSLPYSLESGTTWLTIQRSNGMTCRKPQNSLGTFDVVAMLVLLLSVCLSWSLSRTEHRLL